MDDGGIEGGRGAVTGFGDLAARATLQDARVVREVEPALELVRVVAVEARLLEQGEDVVIVGDLVDRPGGEGEENEEGKQQARVARSPLGARTARPPAKEVPRPGAKPHRGADLPVCAPRNRPDFEAAGEVRTCRW